MAIEKQMLIR